MDNTQQTQIPERLFSGTLASGLAVGLTVIFSIFGWWYLIWVGPLVGGLFFLKSRYAILLGILSVTVVWGAYLLYQMLTNSLLLLYDQLGALILGKLGYNWIFVTGILIIGVCFGALGGWCGSSLRKLLPLKSKK